MIPTVVLQALWYTGVFTLIAAVLPWRKQVITRNLAALAYAMLIFVASINVMEWLGGRG